MSIDKGKEAAGYAAALALQSGMRVGLGTGSTVRFFLQALAQRLVEESLHIQGVPSSRETEVLARTLGIPLLGKESLPLLDVTVDGADEVAPSWQLIKGGGGALFREKILAQASQHYWIIATEEKLVSQMGAFGLPVEIAPFGFAWTIEHIQKAGYKGAIRYETGEKPFVSDQGNWIYDLHFAEPYPEISHVHSTLIALPGVIETGFFSLPVERLFLGDQSGRCKIQHSTSPLPPSSKFNRDENPIGP